MKYKFICPIFRLEVRLYVGENENPRLNDDLLSGGCCSALTHTVVRKNNVLNYFVVWVQKADGYGDMVHETLHLTKRIFDLANVPFNSDNDEIIAYYQNYWVRIFWHKMSKNLKEVKTWKE